MGNIIQQFAIACIYLGIFIIGDVFVSPVPDKNAGKIIKWKRSLSPWKQIAAVGLFISALSIYTEWYITAFAIPAVQAGGWKLGAFIFQALIGIGLGSPVGKHLTHKDYSAVTNHD